MEFLSLRNLLKAEKAPPGEHIRLIALLLQGISMHAVDVNPDDLNAFRVDLSRIADSLDADAPEKLLLAVGAANFLLASYNRQVTQVITARKRELQVILAMMTETIGYLGKSSQTEIDQLRSLEKDLEQASLSQDIHKLRERIADCLKAVRVQSARMNNESSTRIGLLTEGLKRSKMNLEEAPLGVELDSVTGLPDRECLELRVSQAIESGAGGILVVLLVNGLNSINGRFGRTAGDSVLLFAAQHLAQELPPNTPIFRWSGPAFVVAFEANHLDTATQAKICTIASAKLNKTIQLAGRSIMLSITFTSNTLRLFGEESAAVVFGKLDAFASAHST